MNNGDRRVEQGAIFVKGLGNQPLCGGHRDGDLVHKGGNQACNVTAIASTPKKEKAA